MRTERRSAALAAAPAGQQSNPLIEITPTPEEYRQLCHDLAKLRKLGAPSNTAAVLAAVRTAAGATMGHGKRKNAGGAEAPPARQQEVES